MAQQMETKLNLGNHEVPDGVDDFDKENWNDAFQVSHYAMDIFNYLRSKEVNFTFLLIKKVLQKIAKQFDTIQDF